MGMMSGDRERVAVVSTGRAEELAGFFSWCLNPTTLETVFSPSAEAILGFAPPPAASDILALIHPEDRDAFADAIERGIRGQDELLDTECRLVDPETGVEVWVQCRAAIDRDNGAAPSLTGVARNITEHKRAEAERDRLLRQVETERRALAEVFDQAPSLMCVLRGPDLVFEQANACYRHVVGSRDLIGKPIREALPELEGQGFFELLDHVYQTGETFVGTEMPVMLQRQPGQVEERHMHVVYQALRDPDGAVTGIVVQAVDVTDQVRAEEAHRESETRFRLMADAIPQIVWLTDADGRIEFFNQQWFAHTGAASLPGTAREVATDFIHPDDVQVTMDTWLEARRENCTFLVEHRIRSATGEYRWFLVRAEPYRDPETGEVRQWFGTSTDVHERRLAEDRLRSAIEIETVGVIFFKADGAVTFANEAFLRMSGYSQEDVENGQVRWDTMTPPEWMPASLRAIDEFLAQGRTTPYEKEYVRKNGSRWWALFAASRIDDEEGVEFIIDITASKRAEVERDRLAAIVQNSRDAVIGFDLDGTITDWNQGASSLFGYTVRQAIGHNVAMLTPPERETEPVDMLQRLSRGEDIPPFETVRRRRNGSQVEVEIRLSVVRDSAQRITGGAAIVRDVSDRKRLERTQEDFLAMVSHDLRSPITVLSGRAQLMQRRKTYDADAVAMMLEQVRRMERLVADLQELVRMESGSLELNRSEVDLTRIARDAAHRIQASTTAHSVGVEAPDSPVMGDWDRDRLGQVLDNLIGNAIKYSPDGGEVAVRIDQWNDTARVSITDEGPGIPPEMLPHLFDRFYRADSAGETQGLGLGLYIARMLVEAHGGEVSADSTVGEGSTFTIVLPVGAVTDESGAR